MAAVTFFIVDKKNIVNTKKGLRHCDVTIALLLPSLRRRLLTKYEMATSADSTIDEIECYHSTQAPLQALQ
jgi:hypothetical protein